MSKRNEAAQALEDSKSDIGWGSQIRSYVLMTHVLKTCVQVLKTPIQVQS
jgi:protein subunit release factor B